ncbi:hypothetical protein HC928_10760 [bacterium]|nr:hypothetical protein [bacterium]
MSRKTNTTATKEEATPALVPKRRFPEFRRELVWEHEQSFDLDSGVLYESSAIF